jgi:hypothetical protein
MEDVGMQTRFSNFKNEESHPIIELKPKKVNIDMQALFIS